MSTTPLAHTSLFGVGITMKRVTGIPVKLLQHVNIHFCVKLGCTLDDTFLSLKQVYGRCCLHCKTVKKWFDEFTNGGLWWLISLEHTRGAQGGVKPTSIESGTSSKLTEL